MGARCVSAVFIRVCHAALLQSSQRQDSRGLEQKKPFQEDEHVGIEVLLNICPHLLQLEHRLQSTGLYVWRGCGWGNGGSIVFLHMPQLGVFCSPQQKSLSTRVIHAASIACTGCRARFFCLPVSKREPHTDTTFVTVTDYTPQLSFGHVPGSTARTATGLERANGMMATARHKVRGRRCTWQKTAGMIPSYVCMGLARKHLRRDCRSGPRLNGSSRCVPGGEASLRQPEGWPDNFSKTFSLGDRTKFRSTTSADAHRGAERVTARVY